MKFEILKDGEAVEIRIAEDDGSFTIWVCDNEQTAVYKLAALMFSRPEDEKRLKRSILVGNFTEKKPEKKLTIEEIAKKSEERLKKIGLFKKEGVDQPTMDQEQLYDLLKKLTEQAKVMPLGGGFIPSVPNYPGYPMPYVGDPVMPLGGQPIGIIPGWPNGGEFSINYCASKTIPAEITMDSSDMCFSNAADVIPSSMKFAESAVGSFKTTMGATVNIFKASSLNSGNL